MGGGNMKQRQNKRIVAGTARNEIICDLSYPLARWAMQGVGSVRDHSSTTVREL